MIRNPQIDAFFAKLAAANVQHRCNWQAKRSPDLKGYDIEHLSFVGDSFSPSEATAILISYGDNGYGLYFDSGSNSIADDVARIAKPRGAAPTRDNPDRIAYMEHLLTRNLEVWEDEEDSVQEEHADLIAELKAFVDSLPMTRLTAADFASYRLPFIVSSALAKAEKVLEAEVEARGVEDGGYEFPAEPALEAVRSAIEATAATQSPDHPSDTIDALVQAESFMSGFEDDPGQEGVKDTLAGLRAAILREAAAPEMLVALHAVMRCARGEMERPVTQRQPWAEAQRLVEAAIAKANNQAIHGMLAAAPDMLAVLIEVAPKDFGDTWLPYPIWEKARDAIAKAEGR